MGNSWFYVSTVEHFWVQRRFDVLRQIAGDVIEKAGVVGEIGCGHGLVQRQIEDFYRKPVKGFDLNEVALKKNVSRSSPVCCYDIFHRLPEEKDQFDALIMFDVLEHLPDEDAFLQAAKFHLAPGGKILINLPAFSFLWSKYDVAQGHYRRYNLEMLRSVVERNGMRIVNSTYWGMPLTPVLLLRRVWTMLLPEDKAIAAGFETGSSFVNKAMGVLSRLETIPQHVVGTSVMAVLENRS